MRADSTQFAIANEAPVKRPRYVIAIMFDVGSMYFTSHSDIASVPGVVFNSVLLEPSAVSQRLVPDEGRTEIGSFNFRIVDRGGTITDELRAKLGDGTGLKGKVVKFWCGFEGFDFSAFQLFQTQIVTSATEHRGTYTVQCSDISREQRKDVFEPVFTTLRNPLTTAATTIDVYDTSRFSMNTHGASWSDAPNQTVGYLKIGDTLYRYTGKSADQFTGVTQAVLNTKAIDRTFDGATAADRRPKVEEYIYLELPAVKAAIAILTGHILGNLLGTQGTCDTDSNADGRADGWQNYSNSQNYSLVTGRTGGSAQRFEGNGGATPRMGIDSGRYVPPGQTFTISAWMYAAAGQQLLLGAKGFATAGGTETVQHGFEIVAAIGTGTWQRLTRTLVSDAAGPYIRVQPGLSGTPAAGTAVVFDDVQIEIGPSATDFTSIQGSQLPAHWNLGIDPAFLRLSDFYGIGSDLWAPLDDSAALVLRFEALKKTDGKRFLEKEIYLLTGCYSPIYSDGTLGLRRLPALISDAAPVATVTEREIMQHSALLHDLSGMHNTFRVNWNFNPLQDDFTRITIFQDAGSVAMNGTAPIKEYSFRGLHGSRHTDAIIRSLLDALRDSYSYPPERTTIEVPGSLSKLEIGDVIRDQYTGLRDYAGNGPTIDRSFLILNKTHHAQRNTVSLELFGSTFRPSAEPPTETATAPLPDAYYNGAGTALSSVLTIVGNVVQPGTYTINGTTDVNAAGSIFYHLNDLTIADGATINITGNVQLRIRGHLTINGDIVGTGGGVAGVSDSGATPWDTQTGGTPGFIGHSRGWDGIRIVRVGGPANAFGELESLPAVLTRGKHDAFPFLDLQVSGSSLLGVPPDLRGGGGGPGGRIAETEGFASIVANGGAGAAGGAGLVIVCRGMSLGISASITLNGASSVQPGLVSYSTVFKFFPGCGGAGAPGALLILLDGNALSVPDLTGKFFALAGSVPQQGFPLPDRRRQVIAETNWSGYADPSVISGPDWSNAAHRIQYIPEAQTANPDVDSIPSAPSALSVTPGDGFNTVRATVTFAQPEDVLEVWASIDNNRANAVRVAWGRGTEFTHELPVLTTRWYWVRSRRDFSDRPDVFSAWLPSGATSGIAATTLNLTPGIGWSLDAEGKPRGIRAVEGITNRSQLQFGGIGIQILGSPDADVAYGFAAIPIDDTATYQLTIRHKSSATSTNGLYLRFNELNTALPSGKTHIGATSFESVVTTRSSNFDLVSNGPMPGTTAIEETYTYTPTSGTKVASFSMYSWTAFTGTYEVEWVRLTKVGSPVNLLMNSGGATTEDVLPGAATNTTTAYVSTHTLVNNFGADTTWLAVTTPAQPVDHTIQATVSMDIWKTAAAARTIEMIAVPSAGGPPFYGSYVRNIQATASPGERVALHLDFPAVANTQYIVRVGLFSGGGGTGNVEVRDATLRVEHIKR